jgi:hypothetical protein
MEYSIKSPNALLWKTGYNEEGIRSHVRAGKVTGDWLVCPHGDSANAVTVAEFLDNPSILKKPNELLASPTPVVAREPQAPMSVAAMGWWVFAGSLLAYFLLSLAFINPSAALTRGIVVSLWIATLLKGLEALIMAGAITALLGHAWKKRKLP